MAKIPEKHNKRWTSTEENELKKLAKGDTPTPLIAYKMKRTEAGIRGKASEIDLSLKPTNKSPYNRQKKKK
jgi:hypothetical protein